MILGHNQMLVLKHGSQIKNASGQRKHASKSSNAWYQCSSIGKQQHFEAIQNSPRDLFADYVQSGVADENVTCQPKYDHIVKSTPVGSVANREHRSCHPAANQML